MPICAECGGKTLVPFVNEPLALFNGDHVKGLSGQRCTHCGEVHLDDATRLSRLAHAQGLAPIVPMEGWGNVDSGSGSSIAPGSGSAAKDSSEAQRIFAANIARLDSGGLRPEAEPHARLLGGD